MLQQLEVVSELESDLLDAMDWVKKWLVDFNAGGVLFDRSNKFCAIRMNMDRSLLKEKYSFEMLGLSFSAKLEFGS